MARVPLAIQLTGANRNDCQHALALVHDIPPLQGAYGRPRHRPDCVVGDRAYDAEAIRLGLRARHVVPLLGKRNTEHGSGLGRWRWVVERTHAWYGRWRRHSRDYERYTTSSEAMIQVSAIGGMLRRLDPPKRQAVFKYHGQSQKTAENQGKLVG